MKTDNWGVKKKRDWHPKLPSKKKKKKKKRECGVSLDHSKLLGTFILSTVITGRTSHKAKPQGGRKGIKT